MKSIPSVSELEKNSFNDDVWVHEKVDGDEFRFKVECSGRLIFGNNKKFFNDSQIPDKYEHTTRFIRSEVNRNSLYELTNNIENLVFFGKSVYFNSINYDWEKTPSFMGHSIYSKDLDQFLPPDITEHSFERIELPFLNVIEKDTNISEDFEFPKSKWYDGPSFGVVLLKNGKRFSLDNPDFEPKSNSDDIISQKRISRVANNMKQNDEKIKFDMLMKLVMVNIYREMYGEFVDDSDFKSEVASEVRKWLDPY